MSSESTYTLFDLISSHRVTSAIYVAIKLGLPDALAAGPKNAADLASIAQADEQSISRLLRALVTIGVCRSDGDHFALTDVGAHLAASAPCSLQAWAVFEAEMLQPAWQGMIDSVRTGKTRAELAGAASSFELMGRDPTSVAIFNAAMADVARLLTPALAVYDFSAHKRIMDVGGGTGELLVAVLKAHPHLCGAVFDLARCAGTALGQLGAAKLGARAQFIAGDFFQSIPAGADIITLKSVIHDWDDARAAKILGNCRLALPHDGKILLIERVMPDAPSDRPLDRASALSDLNMMRGPGGAERTESEYMKLLADSGFRAFHVRPAGDIALSRRPQPRRRSRRVVPGGPGLNAQTPILPGRPGTYPAGRSFLMQFPGDTALPWEYSHGRSKRTARDWLGVQRRHRIGGFDGGNDRGHKRRRFLTAIPRLRGTRF